MRIILAVLLILGGIFPVFIHNNFSFSQMETPEWIAVILFLLIALFLLFVRKKPSDSQPDGIHSMTFSLNLQELSSDTFSLVKSGQQLYLRPYMGENQEQIAITTEKAEVLGFVPSEYQEYVLSKIEGHQLIQTVVTEQAVQNTSSVEIKITC